MSNNHRQTPVKSTSSNLRNSSQAVKGTRIDSQYFSFKNCLYLILVVICFSITSCKEESSKPDQSPTDVQVESVEVGEKKANQKVILFYGNSLTAGYGLDENESFPSLIEDRIDSLGLEYSVVNAGLSGETTSGGLKRIEWVMKQKVDIFILELGANDMLRGLPLDETRKNLAEIISVVKAKNPEVKIGLCEMMAAPNMGDEYVQEFSKIYKDLSSSGDVEFIPFFLEGVAGHEDLLLKDGKHPNAEGQKIVSENIWKSLKDML